MSAEAAKSAFEQIKKRMPADSRASVYNRPFIIATVQGDIHDIGKNIVKLLLENYGFPVIDLGKDVSPETILDAVVKYHAPVVGLSALMTTTVPAMEQTIKLVKEKAPWCKAVVGGSVITREYAEQIQNEQNESPDIMIIPSEKAIILSLHLLSVEELQSHHLSLFTAPDPQNSPADLKKLHELLESSAQHAAQSPDHALVESRLLLKSPEVTTFIYYGISICRNQCAVCDVKCEM